MQDWTTVPKVEMPSLDFPLGSTFTMWEEARCGETWGGCKQGKVLHWCCNIAPHNNAPHQSLIFGIILLPPSQSPSSSARSTCTNLTDDSPKDISASAQLLEKVVHPMSELPQYLLPDNFERNCRAKLTKVAFLMMDLSLCHILRYSLWRKIHRTSPVLEDSSPRSLPPTLHKTTSSVLAVSWSFNPSSGSSFVLSSPRPSMIPKIPTAHSTKKYSAKRSPSPSGTRPSSTTP